MALRAYCVAVGRSAHVELLVDVELVADVFSQHAPLVIAEVIYHNQKNLLALIEQREYLALEDVGTHQMAVSLSGLTQSR